MQVVGGAGNVIQVIYLTVREVWVVVVKGVVVL
jgi:hypothetical protein